MSIFGGVPQHWSVFQLNLHRQWYIWGLIPVAKGHFWLCSGFCPFFPNSVIFVQLDE